MSKIHIPALACAIFWAGAAEAQQAPDEPQNSVIVVTGEKSNRTLQDTLTSVAVTTPERIRQENILTIQPWTRRRDAYLLSDLIAQLSMTRSRLLSELSV